MIRESWIKKSRNFVTISINNSIERGFNKLNDRINRRPLRLFIYFRYSRNSISINNPPPPTKEVTRNFENIEYIWTIVMFDDYYLSFNLCSEIFRSPLSMDFSLSIDSRIDGGISRISIEIKMVAYTRTHIRENYCNIRANYTRWLICRSTRQFFDSSWQNFYFSSYQWTRNFWEYWKYIINCDIRRLICRLICVQRIVWRSFIFLSFDGARISGILWRNIVNF